MFNYSRILVLFSFFLLTSKIVLAHPMPNSAVLLDIKGSKVNAELQLPLNELELAFGHDVNKNSEHLVERLGPQLKSYLLLHIHPQSPGGKLWLVQITGLKVQPVQDSPSGPYKELTVNLEFLPPEGLSARTFTLNYDVIIHQVVTHFALVSIRQDWDNGLNSEQPYQIGVIQMDYRSNTLPPLKISIHQGTLWKGFQSMLQLGMDHIKEGTDHLLFLLTLLLPATLLVRDNRWGRFGGVKYSLGHIFKIVTAFTIGHSITLIIGATGWIHFPGQAIEVLIALSILISAVHAFRPLFPGKEMYIAAGFGLIHGMAFAATLINLNLDMGRTALSILGFNLGIELMQLFIIAITIPWFIILSRNNFYNGLRVTGAIIAGIAAIAWMVERTVGKPNFISISLQFFSAYANWIILALAIASAGSYFVHREKTEAVY